MSANEEHKSERRQGKLVNRPTRTGGRTYDKFYTYVPTHVVKDGLFPFKVGEELKIFIEKDKLIIEKLRREGQE